ncbi:hypothetical protein ACFQZS_06435 [Mucilaginibacter calamicampi]|uniref:Uncharacterized protein n=1 Tax=Mucilaginibacter calamicampi TaxID=1302352 RepID=A0ABW2YTL7_9SPHI
MRKYLQISFWTFTGTRQIIDLGPTCGEWIIYNGKRPVYHIDTFDNAPSNKLINSLLSNGKETIEGVVEKINIKNGTRLSFGKGYPSILINKKEETISLDLRPLPMEFLTNIS